MEVICLHQGRGGGRGGCVLFAQLCGPLEERRLCLLGEYLYSSDESS